MRTRVQNSAEWNIYLLKREREIETPKMTGNMEIAALLVLLVTELTLGDMVNSMLNRKDPCTSLCEQIPIDFPNNMYIKSCCQRGCRFFNLVDLRYRWEQNSLNGTRSACEASCTEAYTNLNDRYACSTGCNFMAKQRISNLLSLFTIAIYMEESMDILPMSLDMPENDILADPGLRKELLPGWWDSDGFKLPQTYVKTIPMDARTVDYTLSSDYSGETKQPASTSKSESFQREMKQAKENTSILSFGLYVIFVPLVMLSAMTLYLISENDIKSDRNMPYRNVNSSSDLALFIPDEAVMYKVPPPKYESSSRAV